MNHAKVPPLLSVSVLRGLYQRRVITPFEVADAIINRAQNDREMNIWITPPSMELTHCYLEKMATQAPDVLPLWGIPFAVKDNIDLAGVPTTAGCPDFEYIPERSATAVQRLIDAGAFPVGKTNLDQFATGLVGTRSPYGEVHNALREELISGGSSSGSAVAVARGQAAFSLGTDTAGSGRVPAALNGIIGFKPSRGAWSTKGVVPACASLDCVTMFTVDFEDVESVDAVIRGVDDNHPWSREITLLPRALPEKIWISLEPPGFYGEFAVAYQTAWQNAVQSLNNLGIPVEFMDCSFFSQAAAFLYDGPWVAERWADLGEFVNSHSGKIFPVTENILRSGAAVHKTAAAAFTAMHQIQGYRHKVSKMLKDAVLVMPTVGGTFTRQAVNAEPVATNSAMGLYTNHCNLLDLSAIAVPTEDAAENLPFGVTFFATAENEHLLLGLAQVLFKAGKRPHLE